MIMIAILCNDHDCGVTRLLHNDHDNSITRLLSNDHACRSDGSLHGVQFCESGRDCVRREKRGEIGTWSVGDVEDMD